MQRAIETELTHRQSAVVQFIRDYAEIHAGSPSLREIASWLGITPQGTMRHIDALERKGRITRARGQHRSIVAVDK